MFVEGIILDSEREKEILGLNYVQKKTIMNYRLMHFEDRIKLDGDGLID